MVRFLVRAFTAGLIGFAVVATAHAQSPKREAVDVELVIAVDISYSMDPDEQALQRDGYIAAISSREFIDAVRKGPNGRIAVTYVEWSGVNDQKVVVPWQVIDGPEAAGAFVQTLTATPMRRASRTSISGALIFAAALFEESSYRGLRRVIDVSGDGTNNQGPLIEPTRDEVLARGITINGLPIMLKEPNTAFLDIPDLDHYYEDCVIGGPGAFVVPARARAQFVEAIRKKLLLEVAGEPPAEAARIVPIASPPRVSCTIGEEMWRQRWSVPN
jgi:Protein of unknown function (DUF1194)